MGKAGCALDEVVKVNVEGRPGIDFHGEPAYRAHAPKSPTFADAVKIGHEGRLLRKEDRGGDNTEQTVVPT